MIAEYSSQSVNYFVYYQWTSIKPWTITNLTLDVDWAYMTVYCFLFICWLLYTNDLTQLITSFFILHLSRFSFHYSIIHFIPLFSLNYSNVSACPCLLSWLPLCSLNTSLCVCAKICAIAKHEGIGENTSCTSHLRITNTVACPNVCVWR